MKVRGEYCVGCEHCMGCGAKDKITYVCDYCGNTAKCRYDGKDYCKDCLEEMLQDMWDSLSLQEKIDLFGLDLDVEDY